MKNMITIIMILCMFSMIAYASEYQMDENINGLGNDLYNATNINGTNIYQNGSKCLDTDDINGTTFNYSNYADHWDNYDVISDLNNGITLQGENITGGTVSESRLPSTIYTLLLNATAINVGTVPYSRLPDLTNYITLSADNITNGSMSIYNITSSYFTQYDGNTIWKEADCVVDDDGYGDYTTIGECITAVCPNCDILVKNGDYLSTGITLTSNMTLRGSGYGTKIYANTGVNILNLDSTTLNENIHLYNFRVTGNYSAANGIGIYFINVTDSSIDHLWIDSTPQHGIQMDDASHVIISNVFSHNNKLDGVVITDNSYDNIVSDSSLYSNGGYGIGYVQANENRTRPHGNKAIGNDIYNNTLDGIRNKGGMYNMIVGNIIHGNTQHGIDDGSPGSPAFLSNHTIISENIIYDNNQANSSYNGIYTHSCYTKIEGNKIFSTTSDPVQYNGIQLNNDCYNIISNNDVKDSSNSDLSYNSVTNKVFRNQIEDIGDYTLFNQDTNNLAMLVDTEATTASGIQLFCDTMTSGLCVTARAESASFAGAVYHLRAGSTANTGRGLFVQQFSTSTGIGVESDVAGTGAAYVGDCNGDAHCVDIDSEGATKSAIRIQDVPSNIALEIQPGDKICMDNYTSCNDYIMDSDTTIPSNWTFLKNYPSACPAGSAVTQLDDTITCTDGWINIDGDTTSENSSFVMNNSNITGVNLLSAVSIRGDVPASNLSGLSALNDAITLQGENITGGTITFARLPTLTDTHTHAAQNITGISYFNNGITLQGENITGGTISSSYIQDSYLLNTGDTATGNYSFDSNGLFVDADNDKIGIGTANPTEKLTISGNMSLTGDIIMGSSVYIYANPASVFGLGKPGLTEGQTAQFYYRTFRGPDSFSLKTGSTAGSMAFYTKNTVATDTERIMLYGNMNQTDINISSSDVYITGGDLEVAGNITNTDTIIIKYNSTVQGCLTHNGTNIIITDIC